MSGVHPHPTLRHANESVHADFDRKNLLLARERTWEAFHKIKAVLKVGMTENDGRLAAQAVLDSMGSPRNWHRVYVRFGPGTALTFNDSLQKDYTLKLDDPIYLDLGPVWRLPNSSLEYEGDVGDTFILGTNEPASQCADYARELFASAATYWRTEKPTGEAIYTFLKEGAQKKGYHLVGGVDGHRLSDFPHTQYSKERLAGLSTSPTDLLWVLEVQILEPNRTYGAFFEDILIQQP